MIRDFSVNASQARNDKEQGKGDDSGVSEQIVGAKGPAYADYLDEILT